MIQDGFVWGRGALDNKGLGVIFLQALILLKQFCSSLNRDIILLIAADEEVSGKYGVTWLLDHHPDLIKAEYVWDEGGMGIWQSDRYFYYIAIAEKTALTVKLVAQGTAGHASVPQVDNPQDRLVQALSRIKRWRRSSRLTPVVIKMLRTLAARQPFPQSSLFTRPDHPLLWPFLRSQLAQNPFFSALIGDTINLTVLRGGQTNNAVPTRAEARLDVRLLPDTDPAVFLAALRSIISDPKVFVEIGDSPPPQQLPTPMDTLFYRALAETLQANDPTSWVTPYLTPGATDSRFFRATGMKAYGFLPMRLNEQELSRIHGVDERVSIENLCWGIRVVFETLRKLCVA
jgi:acetylornithine deacetylase/succinyl-diaminopimelate desuccinylase-like protein